MRKLLWGMTAVALAILAEPSLLSVRGDPGTDAGLAANADNPDVATLDIKGLKFGVNKGKFQGGLLITDQKGLDGAWPVCKYKDIQEKINNQVDFKKQQLIYFAWSGSSADELTYKVEGDKTKTLVFTYKPGADADSKAHFRLYAFPKGWLHKVEGK